MLRQLNRLTRPVGGTGPGVHAIAVYAEAESAERGDADRVRSALERGVEGVACVDDAARAVVLYCALWTEYGIPHARVAARGLLRFLDYMQDDDGRFNNFILDWAGHKNRDGSTSYPGGPQWQARGLHAMACAAATFPGEGWDERFSRGVAWIEDMPYLDVRAVCVLAALRHWEATGNSRSADRAIAWSELIADGRLRDGRLPNAAGGQSIHWWGHVQEAALAVAGRAFGRPDLIEHARASAETLLLPAAQQCLTLRNLQPFDVSCVVAGLDAVGNTSDDLRFAAGAAMARGWFLGANSAGQAVYDRERGRVYDGIDEGRLSRNSGAESNIESALALLHQMRPNRVVEPRNSRRVGPERRPAQVLA